MNLSTVSKAHAIRTVLLVCVALLSASLSAQDARTRYSLEVRNATLSGFARQVEAATGFAFVYGQDVHLAHPITLQADSLTIGEILQRAFADQPVRYEVKGRHIVLQQRSQATDRQKKHTISGYVTDQASAETLIGANIVNLPSKAGTSTNAFGFYTLTLPEGEVELSISYMGYDTRHSRFYLNRDTVLNVALASNNLLDEVVVTSDRRDAGIESTAMGAHEIPLTQIQHTPVLLGEADLLKTLQLMPGVQAGMEGFSGLYVRGGGPDENLVLLDGIPVYNADHLLGIFSVFTPEAIKNVTLYKSSFPARYGGRLSSVVDVRTNDGDMKHLHGTVSTGTLTTKLHLEGPLKRDRTSFLLSTRGTHTAWLMPLIKTDDGNYLYCFYDVNAKLNHKFSDRSRLFLGFYNGQDVFRWKQEVNYTEQQYGSNISYTSWEEDKTKLRWGNTLASARWNYVFSSRLFSNTTVAFNRYRMSIVNRNNYRQGYSLQEDEEFRYFGYDYHSGIEDWSLRTDFDYTPVPAHRIKFGLEYLHHTFRPETTSTRIKETTGTIVEQDTLYAGSGNSTLRGHELSVYAEDDISLTSRLSANVGLHLSLFHTQGKSYFSAQPRLSARYRLGHGLSAKASFTQMAQYVHLLSSTPIAMPTDLWVPITRHIRPMRANQYAVGLYHNGLPGWEFSVEGYYKQLRNVLEYKDGVTLMGTSTNWEDKVEMGTGRSMGLEFMVQKTTGRTTGWLAYTLAKSDRQFKGGTINHGRRFPYKYDRRHNLSLCLNHKFSDRIDVGASWVFYTGGTATIPERRTQIVTPGGEVMEEDYYSGRNNYRIPASHRLNVGINFNKKTKRGMRTWNISVYNAYNAMNPMLVYAEHEKSYWDAGESVFKDGKTVVKKLTFLPLLPSVTYTFRF